MNIIEIKNLSVEYYRHGRVIPAVRGVSLAIEEGETVALVGESGSGKSTLASAILGLIFPQDGKVTSGEILFQGTDVLRNALAEWRTLRGRDISIIFQDPFSSLNPVLTIEDQLREAVITHFPDFPPQRVREMLLAALREVRFDDPRRILNSFPHQLSGGQRQRVVIAMAIVNRPKLLIADEPTTALDVTIQKEILDLIDQLKKELALTVLLITHNIPLAAERSGRLAVMYAGEIVELGKTPDVIRSPKHPYTRALLQSVPKLFQSMARPVLGGQPPDVSSLPAGCAFEPRCGEKLPECGTVRPEDAMPGDSRVKCLKYRKGT